MGAIDPDYLEVRVVSYHCLCAFGLSEGIAKGPYEDFSFAGPGFFKPHIYLGVSAAARARSRSRIAADLSAAA